jgi:hypothetical protein
MAAFEQAPSGWQRLGDPDPSSLMDSRNQLHWAAQLASAAASALVEPREDDSHTAFEWLQQHGGVLAGNPLPGGVRVAVRPSGLEILLLDASGALLTVQPLDGETFAAALDDLSDALRSTAVPVDSIDPPPVDPLPDHPVGRGAPFSIDPPDAFAELGRWYANADLVLRELREAEGGSPVRCWPHHFDIATLITLSGGIDPEAARSIGVGMTPGDAYYAEPYWYVTPWPYPAEPRLEPLAGEGSWHREKWLGAVLPASRLVAAESATAQADRLTGFLRSALRACRAMLGADA